MFFERALTLAYQLFQKYYYGDKNIYNMILKKYNYFRQKNKPNPD